jgi:hypothetical protein
VKVIKLSPQEEKHDPKAQDQEDEQNEFLLLVGKSLPVASHLMFNEVGCRFLDDGDKFGVGVHGLA